MTITATRLTQAAGVCAAVAGAIFIGVNINHPHVDIAPSPRPNSSSGTL